MSKFKFQPGYLKSIKWGTASVGISLLKQLLLVPTFILGIGSHGYAFWLSMTAVVVLINGLNSGHLHYSANLLSLVYHKTGAIDKEIGQFQGASLIYALIQFVLGVVLFIPSVLSLVTSFDTEYILRNNLQFAFIFILAGRIVYQYFSSFLVRLFEPIGDIHISIKYRALADFFELVITGSVIYFTGSILYTAVSVFFVCIFFSVLNYNSLSRRAPFKISLFRKIDIGDSLLLIKGSFVLNASFWVEKAYDVGLNLVIVRFFGTATLPVFSTSRVMINVFTKVTNVAILPAFPEIQKQFALNNLQYIYNKIQLYWRISVPAIVIAVTIGIPMLPYIYAFWTKDELKFSPHMVGFLIIAVTFQNFGTLINELLKKTNYSFELLVYNTCKLSLTIACLILLSYYSHNDGVGIALAVGEAISVIYLLHCFINVFGTISGIRDIVYHILPTLWFCIFMLLFMFSDNYWIILIGNLPVILFLFYREFLKSST